MSTRDTLAADSNPAAFDCRFCPDAIAHVATVQRATVCPGCSTPYYPRTPPPPLPPRSPCAIAAVGDDPPPVLPVSPRRTQTPADPVAGAVDRATRLLSELRPASHGPVSGGAREFTAIPKPTRTPSGGGGMASPWPSGLFAMRPRSPVVAVTERLRELEDLEAAAVGVWRRANRPKRGEGPKPLPVALRAVAALRWLRTHRSGLTRGLQTLHRALGRGMATPEQTAAWRRAKAVARRAGQEALGKALMEAAYAAWFGGGT